MRWGAPAPASRCADFDEYCEGEVLFEWKFQKWLCLTHFIQRYKRTPEYQQLLRLSK